MRKYIVLLTCLLAVFQGFAQPWTPVDEHQYNDETVVYASVWNRNTVLDNGSDRYTVAAFIDDECRAVAVPTQGTDGKYLFLMRVYGDRENDKGKTIEFRIYDKSLDLDFTLQPDRTVSFSGESEGTPSQTIPLRFAAPSSITLNPISILVGQQVSFLDYLVVTPDGSTLPNGISWSIDADIALIDGNTLKGTREGNTYYNLLIYNKVFTSATLEVAAAVGLDGFTVDFSAPVAGESAVMTITPIPADAQFSAESLTLEFIGQINGWTAAEWQLISSDPVQFQVTPLYPGWINVTLNLGSLPLYDRQGNTFTGFDAAAPVALQEGWQWKTNAFADVLADNFSQVYGGDALTEIRTQDHLLYNDPEWGYFGTLLQEGLHRNVAYKVLMNDGPVTGRLYNAQFAHGLSVVLDGSWTWLPSPYWYDRLLSNAIDGNALSPSTVIISKEKGSAEWDGTQWVGDLQVLPAGESLLCYNPSDDAFTLTFADETLMTQGHEQPANGVNHGSWEYDAAYYRDNMTMVAVVEGLAAPRDYSIGAFVNGECRGAGGYADGGNTDGRFFITVHARYGETVSFILCHEPSGSQYPIDETLTCQTRLGSLAAPVRLHASSMTTGITVIPDDTPSPLNSHPSTATYDLLGRRVPDTHPGILIIRQPGHLPRKILK